MRLLDLLRDAKFTDSVKVAGIIVEVRDICDVRPVSIVPLELVEAVRPCCDMGVAGDSVPEDASCSEVVTEPGMGTSTPKEWALANSSCSYSASVQPLPYP